MGQPSFVQHQLDDVLLRSTFPDGPECPGPLELLWDGSGSWFLICFGVLHYKAEAWDRGVLQLVFWEREGRFWRS